MTPLSKRELLADEEIISRLATEVMGWKRKVLPDSLSKTEWWWEGSRPTEYTAFGYSKKLDWSPLFDWNHWRQVELKMLENEKLTAEYCIKVDAHFIGYLELPDGRLTFENKYMQADLRTRCTALLQAIDSLKQS